MNGIIWTFICGFWEMFKKSGIYAAFDKLYNAISSSFSKSVIVGGISGYQCGEDFLKSSFLYRAAEKIFVFLTAIRERCGKQLADIIRKSVIISSCRGFLHSVYALNIRTGGILLLAASLACFVVRYVVYSSFVPILAAAAAVGALCIFTNRNIADFLNHSAVVGFFTRMLGLEIDYAFYKSKEIGSTGAYVVTALTGILAGAAAAVNIKYGVLAIPAVFAVLCVISSPIAGVYFAVISAPFVPTMVLAGICILTMISLFLRSLYVKVFRWKFGGVGFGITVLSAIFFITSFTSFARRNSLTVWAMYFVFMSFYFVILNSVKNLKRLDGLMRAFVISGAFVAAYGIMQYIFGWNTSNAWI
ncbi:MAG: hypothetical protein J1F64_04690, partial [Oscillospiraceae bacterium]|nr:hypothetical protein [Oscillospiraceae bacterium]